jgi:probable HAF family extracellular repeat protein
MKKSRSHFILPLLLSTVFLSHAAHAVTPTDPGSLGGNASDFGEGLDVSSDGSVIVGYSYNGTTTRAFKYVGSTMTDLGALGTNPTNSSVANAVSSDGTVIVGQSYNGTAYRAFKYVGSTMTELGALGTNPINGSYAYAVSSDGSVIIGQSYNDTANRAFKYVGSTMTELGALGTNPNNNSYAIDVSADGTVIVGYSDIDSTSRAFKYVGSTMTDLGALGTNPTNYSAPNAVSSDGTVIVGYSYNGTNNRAFKYVGSTMTDLGVLGTNPTNSSIANDVSSDGTVIVGYSYNGTTNRAFKYVGSTMTDLGALGTNPTNSSIANNVSADGTVIVGHSYNDTADRAFKYTTAGGMEDLGALGTDPNNYSYARAVSSDGTVIVGESYDGITSRAVIWADNRGIVDVADWMSSIAGANSVVSMSNNLEMTFVEGAHHRTMMSYDNMGKKNQVWATGDFGSSSRTTDSNITTGEVGVSTTLADGIIGGIAVGYGAQNTDLAFDGSAAIKGNFILGELDYLLPDKQSIFSVLVAYGKWNADTVRGYTVGGPTPDYSNGTTDTTTSTIRLRLDGQQHATTSNISITPFISMNWTQTKADAYTETGGAYPALFDAQSHTSSEGRFGLVASYKWSENTKLMASAEWIHRFDDKPTMLTGTDITGAMPFATSSAAPIANQARFGFDVDQRLDKSTLLNFSVHFAGLGASPDVQGALSLRRAF